ncbi:prothymosin alpha-like isoform X2 [Pyrus x bretschneideri]|uniref:prothymosin alpha-like isoform X1 n=1 Tax=Pyrus x bretschneideri TaxID=225117 RepID=UPI002030917E|nr:prothymosin alpha-like isoform X1 [Pyrus x bretschneideri]XP_048422849.1 prothymosin alpha-like isoform X2 [Pyrus x bretschneideri]
MEMKALDSDSGFGDDGDVNSNELNMEQEEDDFDGEHDGEEEEEESENEEEDGEEVGEEENDDGKNVNKDAEMEELEKEYMNLRHQEHDILKKDLLKGQAVKRLCGTRLLSSDSCFRKHSQVHIESWIATGFT